MRLPPTATSTDTPFPYTTLFRSATAHRIERNGEFLGAAVIFVPAGLMADFWTTLDLGANSSVGLLRDDGWLIARHPVPDDTMNLADQPLFTDYLPNAPSGAYSSTASPADGVGRIVGYYRVPDLPVIAVAGLSSDAAMNRFWARLEFAGAIEVPKIGRATCRERVCQYV